MRNITVSIYRRIALNVKKVVEWMLNHYYNSEAGVAEIKKWY